MARKMTPKSYHLYETVVRDSCSRKMTLPNRDGGNLTVSGFAWKRTAATVCVLASVIEKPAEEMVVARVHVSLNVFSVSDSLGPRLLGEDARLDTFH